MIFLGILGSNEFPYMGELEPHNFGGNKDPNREDINPLFDLGEVVGTPRALQALQDAEQNPLELLFRHVTGDWGELDDEDKAENDLSVEKGFRILSSYKLETGVNVWLITESDRSVTTFLLPEEY